MNAKLFAISLNPRTYKAGGEGKCHPPISFFQIFEKTIYSKGLKLSVAVHSSFADILICQNYPFQDLARVFPQQQKIAITNETNK